ncbi:hypothetical protein J6590_088829 [Homalodisca vitripennis]|nr:hypothetical protein J6590_088829 [Homalodisca vitripennis]
MLDVNEEFNRKKLKSFDASNLPPCKAELLQQFRRANYIASVWNNAHMKLPSIVTPENCGWTLEDNQYQFHWFDGDQLPSFVSESLQTEEEPPHPLHAVKVVFGVTLMAAEGFCLPPISVAATPVLETVRDCKCL